MKDVLNSVTTMPGVQSAMTVLESVMQMLHADSWGYLEMVCWYCASRNSALNCCLIAGATAQCCAAFGQGTGDILLDDLLCSGSEASLFNCPNSGIGIHNCVHSEDAGVVCQCMLM